MWSQKVKSICLGLTSLTVGFVPQFSVAGDCGGGWGAGGMLPANPHAMVAPWGMVQQNPLSVSPPPGTLGRTYDLPSREIPADKHPRVGMIDVLVRGASSVRVLNINPLREEDDIEGFQAEGNNSLWRFETEPLMPGIPQIYKVIFRFSEEPNAEETVRYVRLIPGRIVELVY